MDASIITNSQYIPLNAHFWNDITVCVKFPEALPHWRYILSIFSNDISWVISAGLIIFGLIVMYFYSGFEKYPINSTEILTYVAGVMTNNSVPIHRIVRRDSARFYISLMLICAFHADLIYNAMFFDLVMVTRYQDEIKTIDEVMSRNIPFVTTPEISVKFLVFFCSFYWI